MNESQGLGNPSFSVNSQWGSCIGDNIPYSVPDYWWNPNIYQPIIREYYPVYSYVWNEKNKIELAFKIVQTLVDKKIISITKVKDFIELVNELTKVV